jgi:hypothetical protein
MQHSSILLDFSPDAPDLRNDLSAVVLVGDCLWLASDEQKQLERLRRNAEGGFSDHRSFPLSALIDLPAEGNDELDQEIDIEGLAFDDGYLWLVGSHSIKRKKAESKKGKEEKEMKDQKEGRRRLAHLDDEGNRYLLARIPLRDPFGEDPTPVERIEGEARHAAQLKGTTAGSALTDAIRAPNEGKNGGDKHLGRFLSLPGKENGFDIEGLAVRGSRIFIGLRGPVLRGWSVLLEIEVEEKDDRRLGLRRIGSGDELYHKHFLQLDGLGIRDLCIAGDDLLILAGPSMDHDGPIAIYTWKGGADPKGERLLWRESFGDPITVAHRPGKDRAEGMSLLSEDDAPRQVLIVYDSPHKERLVDPAAVRAGIFEVKGEG